MPDPGVERLFAGLEQADVEKILRLAEVRMFPRGTTVLAQGDAPSGIYAIVSGRAEVLLPDPVEGELQVAELGPGDVVGEISALTGDAPSADVVASTLLRCLVIPAAELENLLLERPQLMLRLLRMEARRLRGTVEWRP